MNSILLLPVFLFILLAGTTSAKATTLIVSDIDDTIKDTEVLHKKALAKKARRIDLPFKGMSELYHHLVDEEKGRDQKEVHIVYLSNAPEKGFGKIHRSFVRINNFPEGMLYLRRNFFDQNHKFNTLDYLLKTHRPKRVILIGDNGERDAEIYQAAKEKLFQKYGVESQQIFIRYAYPRSDKGKKILEGQYPFLNAADIALTLYRMEYLSLERTLDILSKSIVERPDGGGVSAVLANWVDCREFYKLGLSAFQIPSSERDRGLLSPYLDLNFEGLRHRCDRPYFVNKDESDEDRLFLAHEHD